MQKVTVADFALKKNVGEAFDHNFCPGDGNLHKPIFKIQSSNTLELPPGGGWGGMLKFQIDRRSITDAFWYFPLFDRLWWLLGLVITSIDRNPPLTFFINTL